MENKNLLHIMEKCGHFLYHRRGGKRGQLKTLRLIAQKGAITQKELLEILTLKSGSVSEMVKKLEGQGFITKERDAADRRKINIAITDKGRSFIEEQSEINEEQEKVLFTSLSISEQQELERLLEKLFEDWKGKFDSSLFNHIRGDKNA